MRNYLIALLMVVGFSSQAQVHTTRTDGKVTPVDYDLSARYSLKIPVVVDTASALSHGGVDSLGLVIQVRSTGEWWKRDTVPTGGHVWTKIGSGGGTSDSGIVARNGVTKTVVAGTIYLESDTGFNASKWLAQKKADSLGAIIDTGRINRINAIALKRNIADTTNQTGAPLMGRMYKSAIDSMKAANDARYLQAVSTANSVQGNGTSGTPVQLVGDNASPGNSKYYGTDGGGTKGYYVLPGGGPQTYQQVLTTGSTLTQPNSINNGAFRQTSFNGLNLYDSIAINPIPNYSFSNIHYGTSISAGTGASNARYRWITLTDQRMNVLTIDSSVSGSSLQVDFRAKVPNVLVYDATKYKYLFIEFTTNDIINTSNNVLWDTAHCGPILRTGLDSIINASIKNWPANRIVLVSSGYIDSNSSANATMARQRQYLSMMQSAATTRGTKFVNMLDPELNLGGVILLWDGAIHPNDWGHELYAKEVRRVLLDSVRAQGQAIGVNGVTELQNLTLRITDTAKYKTVPLGIDDSTGQVVRYQKNQIIYNSLMLPPATNSGGVVVGQAAAINLIGGAYFGPAKAYGGYASGITNTGELVQIAGGLNVGYVRVSGGIGVAGVARASLAIEEGMVGTTGYLYTYGPAGGGNICLGCGFDAFTILGGSTTVGSSPIQINQNAYFSSPAGFKQAAPTALLHLGAGVVTGAGQPMKFTSGPPLTTPETGAVGFSNGLLMLDSSNTVHDTVETRSKARNDIAAALASTGGSYTPTVTGTSNVSAVTTDSCFWTKNGPIITVFGVLSVTPTTGATSTTVDIELPIASNLGFTSLNGLANTGTSITGGAVISGRASNHTANFGFVTIGTSLTIFRFSFSYYIH